MHESRADAADPQSLKRTRGSRPVADDASPRRLVGGHGPNHGRRAGTAPVAPHRDVTLTGLRPVTL